MDEGAVFCSCSVVFTQRLFMMNCKPFISCLIPLNAIYFFCPIRVSVFRLFFLSKSQSGNDYCY